jgi:hypothetical protein
MNTRVFKKGDIIQRGDYKYIVAKGTTPDYMIYKSIPRGSAQGGIPMPMALVEFTLVTPRESRKQLNARITELEEHIKSLQTRLHEPGSNPHEVDEFYPKDAENNSA